MTTTVGTAAVSDLALDTYLDQAQLKKDIAIDSVDITKGLMEQPGLFMHYASQAVRARRQYERYRTVLEVAEAQLDTRWREVLQKEAEESATTDTKGNTKVKAVTEAMVGAAIKKDPLWKNASKRLADAQEIMKLCDVAERAFEHRKDMLLQIARDAARAAEGPLRVMANQGAAASRETLLARMAANAKGEGAAV